MSAWKVATFYRFVEIESPRDVRDWIQSQAESLNVLGTLLVAGEGFNSTLAAQGDGLDRFFERIAEREQFADLHPRWSECPYPPFDRLKVRVKREIVRMRQSRANPNAGVGEYLNPAAWNQALEDPSVSVIDVRNKYEVEVGTFQGAVDPQTDEFWQFPAFMEAHYPDRTQPLALFCTGGIRCERATAYLLSEGYQKVMHLQGGILRYLAEVPEGESKWRGECFVFDARRGVVSGLKPAKLEDEAR